MIKLDPKAEINAEVIFSNLMKRKHMVTRFRLPYTAKQVYAMLYEACRVEVAHRHREFNATEQYKKHLWDISNWITSEASTFGLFLCDNTSDVARYKRLRQIEILAIDELGSEPKESIHYGDYVTAAMDMLSFRYEEQFCTLVSSNLTAKEIAEYYDERIADRFREMMLIINFGNEQSFRKQ